MNDPEKLGGTLREARDRRGLSQQAVAQFMGLPRTAITNIESGTRAVSTLELGKFGDLYGCEVGDLLNPKNQAQDDPLNILPRRLPDVMNDHAVRAEIEKIIECFKEGAHLRRLLSIGLNELLPKYAPRRAAVGEAIKQAEVVAKEERRRLGLGIAPAGDLAELISGQGIWVAATSFHDSLSGLFLNGSSVGMAIVINSTHTRVRQRFSYAHEYAHALFDRDQTLTITQSANASDLAEKAANAFAAAFLMPAEGITEQLRRSNKGEPSRQTQSLFDVTTNDFTEAEIRPAAGSQSITYQDVATLARHFIVSYDAVVWRLKSLGRITLPETKALLSQKNLAIKYGETYGGLPEQQRSSQSPTTIVRELNAQIIRLATEAYRRKEISRGRLQEISKMLNMLPRDLVELAEAARAN